VYRSYCGVPGALFCSLVDGYECFGEISCLNVHGRSPLRALYGADKNLTMAYDTESLHLSPVTDVSSFERTQQSDPTEWVSLFRDLNTETHPVPPQKRKLN
jgi:hypothetical protein